MSDKQEVDNKSESKLFHIKIDRTEYKVHEDRLTGQQLRQLANPPIGPDRDLWEVIPGKDDRKVLDTDVIEISNGKRFFTTPTHINPGNSRGQG